MFDIIVTSYIRNLSNLKAILAKAKVMQAEKGIADDVIVNARLALDQFPFAKQVQLMTDYAKRAGAVLCGVENPSLPDTEKSLDELTERIDKTIAFLSGLSREHIADDLDTKVIPTPWLPGKGLRARYYVEVYSIPQFYFHYTTAYAILRHYGLAIGKGDYMGNLELVDAK